MGRQPLGLGRVFQESDPMTAANTSPSKGTAFAQALDDYLDARADMAFAQFNPADAPAIQAALHAKREALIAAFDAAATKPRGGA